MALDKTVLAALIKTLYDAMLPAGSTPASVVYTTPMAEAIVTHISENLDSLVIQGNWNASTNTPDISATTIPGYTWIVSSVVENNKEPVRQAKLDEIQYIKDNPTNKEVI